jgi:hypothetical protein
MFEETIADFSLLDVVRDGARDVSIRHKAVAAILISARTHATEELQAAKDRLNAAAPDLSIPMEELATSASPGN